MKCKNCGAKIRKSDRFCPSCGLARNPEEDPNIYPGSRAGAEGRTIDRHGGSRVIREPLYDEHLYKDSFLEEKKEKRSQALLITLAILLLIALLSAGFVMFYFMIRQKTGRIPASGQGTSSQGVSGTDWSQSVNVSSPNGDDVIMIYPETEESEEQSGDLGETEGAASQMQPDQPQGETQSGEHTEETQKAAAGETEASTEKETAAASENDAVSRIDFSQIARIMDEYSEAGSYGVCVYDLKQKKAYVTGDGNKPMYATAAVTVPILYTAAHLLDEGTASMDDPVLYVNSIGGRGEAFPEQRDGKEYPLSYYLSTMLTYSDNNCINVLIDHFGRDEINRICHEGGFSSVDVQRKIVEVVTDGSENYVSAADLGGMVRDLYSGAFSQIGREYMEQYFRIDETDEGRTVIGLAEGVRDAALFLNQNGMGETRFAEVAVVSDDQCSYIISEMMTGAYGFAYIDAGIEISSYVYEALSE